MASISFDLYNVFEDISGKVKEYIENFEQAGTRTGAKPASPVTPNPPVTGPAVDITADAENFYVEMDLPGMKKEQIRISANGERTLEIAGERGAADPAVSREVVKRERRFGSFRRLVALPDNVQVDFDNAQAEFVDGVLKVKLPKKNPPQRPIEII